MGPDPAPGPLPQAETDTLVSIAGSTGQDGAQGLIQPPSFQASQGAAPGPVDWAFYNPTEPGSWSGAIGDEKEPQSSTNTAQFPFRLYNPKNPDSWAAERVDAQTPQSCANTAQSPFLNHNFNDPVAWSTGGGDDQAAESSAKTPPYRFCLYDPDDDSYGVEVWKIRPLSHPETLDQGQAREGKAAGAVAHDTLEEGGAI